MSRCADLGGVSFARFEPTPVGYQRLAELWNAVWPEQPTCAAFVQRVDLERTAEQVLVREIAVAEDAARPWLAYAEWGHMPWTSEVRRLQLQIQVLPEHRGRGLGSALLDRAWQGLARLSPTSVESGTTEDRTASIGFLTGRGFRPVMRSPTSELDLAIFDPEPFRGVLRRVAAEGVELIRLDRLLEGGPGALRSLYDLQDELNLDLPGHPPAPLPRFEQWALAFEQNPDLLPECHVIAVAAGGLVGMTQLWASQASDRLLYTGHTGVRRAWRRRGIATAMKVLSLDAARRRAATIGSGSIVRTGNEEHNPMLELNRRLGFVERPAWITFSRGFEPG